jgi:hypothetical protein
MSRSLFFFFFFFSVCFRLTGERENIDFTSLGFSGWQQRDQNETNPSTFWQKRRRK